jgi:hypothetical protein
MSFHTDGWLTSVKNDRFGYCNGGYGEIIIHFDSVPKISKIDMASKKFAIITVNGKDKDLLIVEDIGKVDKLLEEFEKSKLNRKSLIQDDRIGGTRFNEIIDISYSNRKTTLIIENIGEKEVEGYVSPDELQLAKSKLGGIPDGYIGDIKETYFTFHRQIGEKKIEYEYVNKTLYHDGFDKFNYIVVHYGGQILIIRNKNEDANLVKNFNNRYLDVVNEKRQKAELAKYAEMYKQPGVRGIQGFRAK